MLTRKINLILTFSLCFLLQSCLTNKCEFNLEIAQSLNNDGFHRDLSYDISFVGVKPHSDWLFKDCMIILEQSLPAGIYANPYELQDLRRMNKTHATSKSFVNVESFTEESTNNTVVILGELRNPFIRLWIPLHARYHAAVAGGGLVTNDIEGPLLFSRCPDDRLQACKTYGHTFLCSTKHPKQCDKMKLAYKKTNSISWSVPVGNTDQFFIVAIGTLFTTFLGTSYLIYCIFKHKT